MSYHTQETNVVICNNLSSDAPLNLMNKIREARGALEAMIRCGVYPPGEYVISRKGLKGNQAEDWSRYGAWGHTFKSAVEANASQNPQWSGDHLSLWVNRVDKKPVFTSTKVNGSGHYNQNYYSALSTATHGLFTSTG